MGVSLGDERLRRIFCAMSGEPVILGLDAHLWLEITVRNALGMLKQSALS
jgi:hypothetical protein